MKRLDKSIIIIGAISSGKSTLANYISDELRIKIASFGGYLNDYALGNRLPNDRKSLQDLGEEFIKTKPEKFLLDVIEFSDSTSKSLIFEGVRHLVIFDLIKSHSNQTLSIFIDVPYDIRKERYLLRSKDIDSKKSSKEFDARNSHVVEMELHSLRKFCTLTISSTVDPALQNILKEFLQI